MWCCSHAMVHFIHTLHGLCITSRLGCHASLHAPWLVLASGWELANDELKYEYLLKIFMWSYIVHSIPVSTRNLQPKTWLVIKAGHHFKILIQIPSRYLVFHPFNKTILFSDTFVSTFCNCENNQSTHYCNHYWSCSISCWYTVCSCV